MMHIMSFNKNTINATENKPNNYKKHIVGNENFSVFWKHTQCPA